METYKKRDCEDFEYPLLQVPYFTNKKNEKCKELSIVNYDQKPSLLNPGPELFPQQQNRGKKPLGHRMPRTGYKRAVMLI